VRNVDRERLLLYKSPRLACGVLCWTGTNSKFHPCVPPNPQSVHREGRRKLSP